MNLSGVVRLRCTWFGSGGAQLTLGPRGESVEGRLARLLFGEKPGRQQELESAERLFLLEVRAVPLCEGLRECGEVREAEPVPPTWCQGCRKRREGCVGGPEERLRCLDLCRSDRRREEEQEGEGDGDGQAAGAGDGLPCGDLSGDPEQPA